MSNLLTIIMSLSLVFALFAKQGEQLGEAAISGAGAAVEFSLSVGAMICLWSGVMEILKRSGAVEAVSGLLSPVLRRLFPRSSKDAAILSDLSANVSANLLGLGNAATPMGIRAARGMARLGEPGIASDELCLLVVINTASIQLLPTTIASVRAAQGARSPFDILPAVLLSSAVSVCAGIAAAKLLSRLRRP